MESSTRNLQCCGYEKLSIDCKLYTTFTRINSLYRNHRLFSVMSVCPLSVTICLPHLHRHPRHPRHRHLPLPIPLLALLPHLPFSTVPLLLLGPSWRIGSSTTPSGLMFLKGSRQENRYGLHHMGPSRVDCELWTLVPGVKLRISTQNGWDSHGVH